MTYRSSSPRLAAGVTWICGTGAEVEAEHVVLVADRRAHASDGRVPRHLGQVHAGAGEGIRLERPRGEEQLRGRDDRRHREIEVDAHVAADVRIEEGDRVRARAEVADAELRREHRREAAADGDLAREARAEAGVVEVLVLRHVGAEAGIHVVRPLDGSLSVGERRRGGDRGRGEEAKSSHRVPLRDGVRGTASVTAVSRGVNSTSAADADMRATRTCRGPHRDVRRGG